LELLLSSPLPGNNSALPLPPGFNMDDIDEEEKKSAFEKGGILSGLI
jgi:hypothetical protein